MDLTYAGFFPHSHEKWMINGNEAADLAGVHPSTITMWRQAGRLPRTAGRPRRWRYHPEDIKLAADGVV